MPQNMIMDVVNNSEMKETLAKNLTDNSDMIMNELSNETEVEQTSKEALSAAVGDRRNMIQMLKQLRPKTKIRQNKKIGRNDPCPCGSGKKYKNCCLSSCKYENMVDA